MKQNPQKGNGVIVGIIVITIIALAVYGAIKLFNHTPNSDTPQAANTQGSINNFNPQLVEEKQKCQDALAKWNAENGNTGIRAHFNANMNTCFIDDLYNRSDGTQMDTVIDAYQMRKVLELDIDSASSFAPGIFLFENGVKVDTSDPAKEYDKRRSILFESNF